MLVLREPLGLGGDFGVRTRCGTASRAGTHGERGLRPRTLKVETAPAGTSDHTYGFSTHSVGVEGVQSSGGRGYRPHASELTCALTAKRGTSGRKPRSRWLKPLHQSVFNCFCLREKTICPRASSHVEGGRDCSHPGEGMLICPEWPGHSAHCRAEHDRWRDRRTWDLETDTSVWREEHQS